jgi:hypothetical protein
VVVAWRNAFEVAFLAVAAKEELADVRADVMLDDEAAAGMLVDELTDVKYEVVDEDQLSSLRDLLFKLLAGHLF